MDEAAFGAISRRRARQASTPGKLPCPSDALRLAQLVSRGRPMAKTSVTDPLWIGVVKPDLSQGRIGITLCPGKKDPGGGWDRDLDLDLDIVQRWGGLAAPPHTSGPEPRRQGSCPSLFGGREISRVASHMTWTALPRGRRSPLGPPGIANEPRPTHFDPGLWRARGSSSSGRMGHTGVELGGP